MSLSAIAQNHTNPYLDPGKLNSLNLEPPRLKEDVSYTSIIGIGVIGGNTFNEDGDGVVSKTSQDLGASSVPPLRSTTPKLSL